MNPEYVTFAKNVFIPITNVCRNNCGYCGFRKPAGSPEATLMTPGEIDPILKQGVEMGCTEALFTFGERPEEEPQYREKLDALGYDSTIEYLVSLCKRAISLGLLPHSNPGVLTKRELEMLKPYNASMGLMLETTAHLPAHRESPGKDPEKRLRVIKSAGSLGIPFTTGILIGIGETREDRRESLHRIADVHERYGHVQEVIVQNFKPKPETAMSDWPAPTTDMLIETVRLARRILPSDVAVQVPPNLAHPRKLVLAGASDLGGVSPATPDYINPEAPWPRVEELREMLNEIPLRERLPIHPQYVREEWYSNEIGSLIERLADEEGLRA